MCGTSQICNTKISRETYFRETGGAVMIMVALLIVTFS